MRKIAYITALLIGLLYSVNSTAQNDQPQTFTLEKPYTVEKIVAPQTGRVKNVVLMIGDGMSLMHVYSAWTANRGHLWLENAEAIGLSKTYCADRLITDSGAGGTALSCGYKTIYHAVGVTPDGKPVTTLGDLAKASGKSAGIAVTCRLWDATPGDFCAHNIDRKKEQEIIADYPDCGYDYIFGGGAKYFTQRADGRNIFNEMAAKGYEIVRSMDDLEQQEHLPLIAVPFDVDVPLPADRGDLLAKASLKGINLLNQNENGFFMMIEGSQLDDYGHFNQLGLLMEETLDFDQTVGAVMKWAAQDGETLVVVTADHETGGLTLIDGDMATGTITCRFSTGGHSGVMVPVYAFGPGSKEFTGIMENTDIFWKIKKLMGLTN